MTAERRAALAATTMPIVLNGFRPSLRGILPAAAGQTEVADQGNPRLLFVVNDTCPGSAVAVPRWIDWIRSSPNRDYSAVIVSIEGTSHLSQIADAVASRGVNSMALQVTQLEEFTLSSGVSVTPTLLAIDRLGHVRFVGGHFSQVTERALEKFLDSEQQALAIH